MSNKFSQNDLPSQGRRSSLASQRVTTRTLSHKMVQQLEKDEEDRKLLQSNLPIPVSHKPTKSVSSGPSVPRSSSRLTSVENLAPPDDSTDSSTVDVNGNISNVFPETVNAEEARRVSLERGLERLRKKIRSSVSLPPASAKREKSPRSSRRLSSYNSNLPKTGLKRVTLESIKEAIDKNEHKTDKLIDVDSLERTHVGQSFSTPSAPDNGITTKLSKPVFQINSVKKQDLQTQTSFILDRIYT